MSQPSPTTPAPSDPIETPTPQANNSPPPSYVKLAMRNMVRKRVTSLFHFALTAIGLLGVLVGLAFLDRYFNS
ncbi:MAG: DUF3285 domain-containing protein [Oscillatoriales cyanobacterium RU_3_3]|nr:DUF3285 domain-containing protein [Oscillatoriales cyanobacterium RU_3_3]NJR25783.1 DUF3285 domain-containing protein [Richelia sp. CSU_2_1]